MNDESWISGIHFGAVDAPLPDYRKADDPDPDDEELAETPPDVTAMLGFDPKELNSAPEPKARAVDHIHIHIPPGHARR